MLFLGIVFAMAAGVLLGLLGGGGSILMVPILVYVVGLPAHQAIATSLGIVGVTSAVATVAHARAGRVRWRIGLVFGAGGMLGAFASGRLAGHLPPALLLSAFGALMLVTAVVMLRRRPAAPGPERAPALGRLALQGVIVGAISGLLGAGGGFLVVPALTILGGLPMPVAVATSLSVITLNSLAGFAGHLGNTPLPWAVAVPVTAAAIVGSWVGGRLTGRIEPDRLRKMFAWLVIAMGAFILLQQLFRLGEVGAFHAPEKL